MRWVWRVLGVAYEEFVVFRRQWMWIAQWLMSTVGIVAILAAWGGSEAARHMAVALLVAGGWGTGLNVAAQRVGWDRIWYAYEKRVASPLTPAEYLLGALVGALVPTFLTELPTAFAIAALAGVSLGGLALVLLLSIVGVLLGLFLALAVILRIRNPVNISAVTNPLQTLTTMLPPVFYSPAALPEPLRSACAAVPTVALTDLGRALAGLPHTYPQWLSAASVAAWLVGTLVLMKRKLNWGLE